MIVTQGKIIVVETLTHRFKRSCEAPGLVVATHGRSGSRFELPGNVNDARSFIEAYWKVVKESISYSEPTSERIPEEAMRTLELE